MANERTTWREAFKMADQVLYMGVRGVTDLMMAPGLVNLDFADIRTVMAAMGKAMMGTGEAEGENRAIRAAEAAINNPLLEDTSMAGARGLLINITGGDDLTLFEVDQAANRIREEVDDEADIIFGSAIDESLQGKIRVSVVATGIDTPAGAAGAAAAAEGGRRRGPHAASRRCSARPGIVPAGAAQAAAQPDMPRPVMPRRASHRRRRRSRSCAPLPRSSSRRTRWIPARRRTPAQDPLVGHDAAPQRVEPTLAPMTEQRAPASTPLPSHGMSAPLATPSLPRQSPNAPPRTARGQPQRSVRASAARRRQPAARRPRTCRAPRPRARCSAGSPVCSASARPRSPIPRSRRAAPVAHEPPAGEQMRPTVRQTTAEDIGIGIPKFLLRQTSGATAPPRR